LHILKSIEHKNAHPVVLTQIYTMMFLSYANDGNWVKVLETYDRMSLAPKLTDADKERFAKIAELAGQGAEGFQSRLLTLACDASPCQLPPAAPVAVGSRRADVRVIKHPYI